MKIKKVTKLPVKIPVNLKKVNRKTLIISLIIIGILGLMVFFKNQFVVAVVNGKPVWRITYLKTLERMSGKQALDAVITQKMVLDEAKKQKISVSKEEVQAEITKFEDLLKQQGQDFNELVAAQGLTRKDVEEEIRMQKIVEKLAGQMEVTETEIDEYITTNKDLLGTETDPTKLRDSIKQQLTQQKLTAKIQEIVASLQEKSKIIKWL